MIHLIFSHFLTQMPGFLPLLRPTTRIFPENLRPLPHFGPPIYYGNVQKCAPSPAETLPTKKSLRPFAAETFNQFDHSTARTKSTVTPSSVTFSVFSSATTKRYSHTPSSPSMVAMASSYTMYAQLPSTTPSMDTL